MCLGVCVIVVPNDRDETIFFVVVGNDKPVCWSLFGSICRMYLWCGGPCGGVSASNCFIVILVGCDDVVIISVVGVDQVVGWVLIGCPNPRSLLFWWLHFDSWGGFRAVYRGTSFLSLLVLSLFHHYNKTRFISSRWYGDFKYKYYNFTNISFRWISSGLFSIDYFIEFMADFGGQSQY